MFVVSIIFGEECLINQSINAKLANAEELLAMESLRDSRSIDPVGRKIVAKVYTRINFKSNRRFFFFFILLKAWIDPDFCAALLKDGTKTIKDVFGIDAGCKLVVFQNSQDIQNLVVCTLCSCYPSVILGRPPAWYKSRSYRARAVFEPRKVIEELGGVIGDGCRLAVHDSTADLRYFVIPKRPESSLHLASEEELAKLVTRDSMIGLTILK